MELNKLKAPFDPKVISWRVGATSQDKTKGIALAYLDARDVMDRLDEVCDPENWQAEYPYKGCCRIGIKVNDEWVWKSNGAGETQVEADKGQYSDAFKRAAVLWGIGRYLYDMQNIWVELEPAGRSYKIKNPDDARLTGALEKAAAGVRAVHQEEPEGPQPFTEVEMNFLKDKLNQIQSMEDFEAVREIAAEAYKRMDKAQKAETTKTMNTLKAYLENKELDQQAERKMA